MISLNINNQIDYKLYVRFLRVDKLVSSPPDNEVNPVSTSTWQFEDTNFTLLGSFFIDRSKYVVGEVGTNTVEIEIRYNVNGKQSNNWISYMGDKHTIVNDKYPSTCSINLEFIKFDFIWSNSSLDITIRYSAIGFLVLPHRFSKTKPLS